MPRRTKGVNGCSSLKVSPVINRVSPGGWERCIRVYCECGRLSVDDG